MEKAYERSVKKKCMSCIFLDFLKGDEQAFRYYYNLYAERLCQFARRHGGDTVEDQDIVQESFLYLFRRREKINEESHILPFLKKVVYFRMVDAYHIRCNRKVREADWARGQDRWVQHPADEKRPEESALNKIYVLYQKMTDRRKDIFELYFYQDCDIKTIARMKGITASTVYNHVYYACLFLAERLHIELPFD